MNLSLSDIKEAFYLSNESPSGIKWNLSKYSGKHNHIQSTVQNSNAGSKGKDYWYVMYKETSLLVHRVIFMLANNLESSHVDFVDHEDGNGHNNVLSNLRNSGPKLNSRNKKMSSANQSGTVGVFIITAKVRSMPEHSGTIYKVSDARRTFLTAYTVRLVHGN